jgi:hypothetical protein
MIDVGDCGEIGGMKIQLSDVSNTECKGYMASNEM